MIFSKKSYFIFILSMIAPIIFSYNYIDRDVATYFITHAEDYKHIGKIISITGESRWYFIIAIVGAIYATYIKKNSILQQRFLFLLYANIVSGLLSIVAKIFFGKIRPWELENGKNQFGFLINQNPDFTFMQNVHYQITMLTQNYAHYTSFPSGHSVTIMTLFTYSMLLSPKYFYIWTPVALLCLSGRVLANDHFVSDIVAGALLGILSTLFVYSKMKNKIYEKEKK